MSDPTDTTQPMIAALTRLTDEVSGLRADVQHERRGRHLTTALAVVILAAALLLSGMYGASLRHDQTLSCESRNNSRSDVRLLAVRIADESAKVLKASPSQRAQIVARAREVSLDTLPPLDC